MKTNKAFLTAIIVLVIGTVTAASAFAGGKLDEIGGKVKKANETVKGVNEVIRDVDETVEGVGGAKEGVKDIGKDTGSVVGIDTSRPAATRESASAENEPVTQAGGDSVLAGTWSDQARFGQPSRFEFTVGTYIYYRGGDKHTSGKYVSSGRTVQLLNESGNEWETITINGNSFEFWHSIFYKQ